MSKQKISPFLWFDTQAEEAVNFYVSIFNNSKIGKIARYGKNMPGPEGSVMTASFEIEGQHFIALNGGPAFKFTEAVSFVVDCENQEEIDHYWDKLTADGGKPVQCGWLTDKFGLSWQIVPAQLAQLTSGDAERSSRVMQALMKMVKLDIKVLQDAYDGQ